MKVKPLFLFLLFVNCITLVYTQSIKMLKIYQKDGNVSYFPLSNIDSVVHDFSGFSSVTFSGDTYQTVILGNGQEWFAENLRTVKYANGDLISNNGSWTNGGTWAWFNNDSTYENPYGKLYNWYAAHDVRNICPTGWHVPSQNEYLMLIAFFGGASASGTKLKSTSFWNQGGGGSNESGLNLLPGGRLFYGGFSSFGSVGLWWSSTTDFNNNASHLEIDFNSEPGISVSPVEYGMSVRCLRD